MSFLDDIFGADIPKPQEVKPMKVFKGDRVADFDPLQTQGQDQVLGIVPQQEKLAGNTGTALDFLLKDAMFPGSNPALQETINYAVSPIIDQLMQTALPAIRTAAEGAGQFGGSFRKKFENQALDLAARNVGGTAANVATHGYDQGLKALMYGLGYAPTQMQNLETPGLTTSGVGDVRQGQAQNEIGGSMAKFAEKQAAKQYADMFNANQTNAYNMYQASQPSPFQQIVAGVGAVAPFFV